MKRYRHENSWLVTDEHGAYVRWLDHAAALLKQDQQHIEDLVIFNDEIKRLRGEVKQPKKVCTLPKIAEHSSEITRLKKECERRWDAIEQKSQNIVERDKIIVERNIEIERIKKECISRFEIIEDRDIEIVHLKKKIKQHKKEHFDKIKRLDIEIEILELSVKKRDEMLIKYEEIIEQGVKTIETQKQAIANYASVFKRRFVKGLF